MVNLMEHQKKALADTVGKTNCAFYMDMGTGKTYTGSERMHDFNCANNLIVCQKSKVNDWVEHMTTNYPLDTVYDLTKPKQFSQFIQDGGTGVINYNLCWRRKDLLNIKNFTLMLDESSMIQHSTSKRTKFILKLKPSHVILLSGTPCNGAYEQLWTQCKLLGWSITKQTFYNQYVKYHYIDNFGFPMMVIDGYKNVDRLKTKLNDYGAVFMTTEECGISLPEQVWTDVKCPVTPQYKKFMRHRYLKTDNLELIGDTPLKTLLYARELCSIYNPNREQELEDLFNSTDERFVVFYNFDAECQIITDVAERCHRKVSIVNGHEKDLFNYEQFKNSVTIVQYQAGAMGLNLQLAHRIIYYSMPLQWELWEQSAKRIHRIGQRKTCFYYRMISPGSVEEKISKNLQQRKDYSDALFVNDFGYDFSAD